MSARRTVAIAVLLLGCAWLAGCSRLLSIGNPDALTPASADDCEKFGHELEQAVAADDAARTTELIGLAGLFRRATAEFEGSAVYKAQRRKHAEEDARNDPFVPLLLASVRRGAQVKLLRVHTVDGRSRALVRYISPRGSVEYFDFLPARGSDGLVAEDIQLAAD